jgi:hypothetical protein
MTTVLKDPNLVMALAIREKFPTPSAIATAPLTELTQLRTRSRPSNAQLLELQQLARETIGTKDLTRQRGLVLEQTQLIRELRMLQEHIQQLDTEIEKIVEQSREGKILQSMGLGPIQAAAVISTIGNILNFRKASELKAYFGWAPRRDQTGITMDRDVLSHAGSRTMKQMMFLIVVNAVQQKDSEWGKLYSRLLPRMCQYDEGRQTYKGKMKVVGRVAGQMIEMMYALLRQDAEILNQLSPGDSLPDPILYDPEVHRRHRNGEYRPIKNVPRQRKIIRLPDHLS